MDEPQAVRPAGAREALFGPGEGFDEGWPVMTSSPFTIEGEIENMRLFGRSGAAASGWRRAVSILVVVAMLSQLIVAVLLGIVRLVQLLG